MLKSRVRTGAILFVTATAAAVFSAFAPQEARASLLLPPSNQVINILCKSTEPCGQFSGTTNDGTQFTSEANPTSPSTGTGVFEPFVRIQRPSSGIDRNFDPNNPCNGSGDCVDIGGGILVPSENGFNSDANAGQANFDTKGGSDWTRSVLMSEFTVTNGGFLILSLDANQLGKSTEDINKLVITQMEIFIGPGLANPEASNTGIENTGYAGTLFDFDSNQTDDKLLGLAPRWSLDNATNGNVDVVLQASICDSNGQCGSGHGDLNVFIPWSLLGAFNPNDNFVLYTEYLHVNDGFEEWRFSSATPPTQVPAPGTLALLGIGLAGLSFARRRQRR